MNRTIPRTLAPVRVYDYANWLDDWFTNSGSQFRESPQRPGGISHPDGCGWLMVIMGHPKESDGASVRQDGIHASDTTHFRIKRPSGGAVGMVYL